MAYVVDKETKTLHTEECALKNVPSDKEHEHFATLEEAKGHYTSECECVEAKCDHCAKKCECSTKECDCDEKCNCHN